MDYAEFRTQLDRVLRTKNPEAVRQFLFEQGQWDEDFSGDVAHAMWMMIAGSPTLQELHGEAQGWLIEHGYRAEAEMLRRRAQAPGETSPARSGTKGSAKLAKPDARGKRGGARAPEHPGGQAAARSSRQPPRRPQQ